jgi:hypothetical protein
MVEGGCLCGASKPSPTLVGFGLVTRPLEPHIETSARLYERARPGPAASRDGPLSQPPQFG